MRLAALSLPPPETQRYNQHPFNLSPTTVAIAIDDPPACSATRYRAPTRDALWCPLTLRSRTAEQPDNSPMATTVDIPL